MDASGVMLTGWQKVGGTWYYLKSSGAMATGWQKLGGTWYYLKASGAMAKGWYKVGGKWYYSNSSGAMAGQSVDRQLLRDGLRCHGHQHLDRPLPRERLRPVGQDALTTLNNGFVQRPLLNHH